MIGYIAHIVQSTSTGDFWQIWLGTAPSIEVAIMQVHGMVASMNKKERGFLKESPQYPWEYHSVDEFDLATVLVGGQVQVASFSYHAKVKPVIKMVQASLGDAEHFSKEDDIDPDVSLDYTDILMDDDLWLDDLNLGC